MLKQLSIKKILLVSTMAIGLAACGGGGGSKSTDGADSGQAGVAVKGPIDGGTVTCYDESGAVVSSATTNSDGAYKLSKKCPATGKLVVTGGTDKSTGEEIEELIASGDSKYITPVTTMQKVMKDNGISLTNSSTKTFLNTSGTTDVGTSGSTAGAKKLVKTGLILHAMVKSLQHQSDEELSYADAMKLVTKKLKASKIEEFGDDAKKSEAKSMIDNVLGTSGLANSLGTKVSTTNIAKIKAIVDQTTTALKTKDGTKNGMQSLIPAELRAGLKRGLVSIYDEEVDGSNYKIKFRAKKGGFTYKCKVFDKTSGVLLYRSAANWASGTTACEENKYITLAKTGNTGKFLIIQYTKGTHTNYSAPHKIGSMALDGTNRQMNFVANKVYLPISTTWTEKTIADFDSGSGKNAANLVKITNTFLPKGIYYKVSQAPASKFKNAVFGVKLTIGTKEIFMMADRLHIKKNAITAGATTAAAGNPYLHGIGHTSNFARYTSAYRYNGLEGYNQQKALGGLSRGDFNTKKGFLRFAPPLSGGTLKLTTDSALKTSSNYDNLVGVSLADMCAVEVTSYGTRKAKMCDIIAATINGEKPAKVVITPFIRATKRGSGMGGINLFKTDGDEITVAGRKFESFPAITILKPTGHSYPTSDRFAGQEGLKAVDSDNDGVSDYWEMKLGRNPFSADNANTDSSATADGISDKDAIKAGLDPRANYGTVTVAVSPSTLDIEQGGSPFSTSKTFTVTVGAIPKGVNAFVNITANADAKKVINVTEGDSLYGSSAKTYTVTSKNWANNISVTNADINVKVKLAAKGKAVSQAAELTKSAQIKKVDITSGDFPASTKPETVSLTYKATAGGTTISSLTTAQFVIGVEITADAGTKASHTTYYKWWRSKNATNCNRNVDGNWTAISGADGTVANNKHKYVLAAADDGKCIRVSAVYVNGTSGTSSPSDWTASTVKKRNAVALNSSNEIVKVAKKPTPTPTLATTPITGDAKVGGTLTAVDPTNKGSFTVEYQWQRRAGDVGSWWDITSATSKTFKIPEKINSHYNSVDDRIRVKIKLTKSGHKDSAEVISSQVGPVAKGDAPATPTLASPPITGTKKVLHTLTAVDPTNKTQSSVAYDVKYQWQRGDSSGADHVSWANITSATSKTYALVAADSGKYIRVKIKLGKTVYYGYDGGYKDIYNDSAEVTSSATSQIAAAATITATSATPTISSSGSGGDAKKAGYTLTAATTSTPTPSDATKYYQWEISADGSTGWTAHGSETTTATLKTPNEAGKYLRVKVRFKKSLHSNSAWATSANFGPIVAGTKAPTPTLASAPITGTKTEGQTLTAVDPTNASGYTIEYQWQRSYIVSGAYVYRDISGATSKTYTTSAHDANGYVKVKIKLTKDGKLDSDEVTSSYYGPINPASSGSGGGDFGWGW